jgi:hypothetical protein
VWELILRKTKWVITAVFAPEIVLYSAYMQWHVASCTYKRLNELALLRGSRNDSIAGENKQEAEGPSKQVRLLAPILVLFYCET